MALMVTAMRGCQQARRPDRPPDVRTWRVQQVLVHPEGAWRFPQCRFELCESRMRPFTTWHEGCPSKQRLRLTTLPGGFTRGGCRSGRRKRISSKRSRANRVRYGRVPLQGGFLTCANPERAALRLAMTASGACPTSGRWTAATAAGRSASSSAAAVLAKRFCSQPKQVRAGASRLEKRGENDLAVVKSASARIWMQFVRR